LNVRKSPTIVVLLHNADSPKSCVVTGLCPVQPESKDPLLPVGLRSTWAGRLDSFTFSCFCLNQLLCSDSFVGDEAMPRPKMDCSWRMGLYFVPCKAQSLLSSCSTWARRSPAPTHASLKKRPSNIPALPPRVPELLHFQIRVGYGHPA